MHVTLISQAEQNVDFTDISIFVCSEKILADHQLHGYWAFVYKQQSTLNG